VDYYLVCKDWVDPAAGDSSGPCSARVELPGSTRRWRCRAAQTERTAMDVRRDAIVYVVVVARNLAQIQEAQGRVEPVM